MAARAPATGGRATALAWAQNGATVLRRGLLVPLVVAVEAGLLALSPLLIAGGALLSLASPWRRVPLRSVLLVLAYALVELRAVAEVAALRRGQPAPHPPDGDPPDGDPPDGDPPDGGRPDPYDEIVHRFVQRLTGAVERILGVRMVLTPDSISGDEVRIRELVQKSGSGE